MGIWQEAKDLSEGGRVERTHVLIMFDVLVQIAGVLTVSGRSQPSLPEIFLDFFVANVVPVSISVCHGK